MTANSKSIGIIGSGAWGSALAAVSRFAEADTLLYARAAELADAINASHINAGYLPNTKLDHAIRATHKIEDVAGCTILLLAVPAQHVRETCARLKPVIAKDTPLVICAKGIEIDSGLLMHDVVQAVLPGQKLAVLSGPTFAAEVAQGLPAACVIASKDAALAKDLCDTLGSRSFRPYSSTDPVGVEAGGAIKNVLAIACGIVLGKGLGENARAALIARGLSEMIRLAVACGGKAETLMGLSGLGDLVLTCSSAQSRNMSLGLALGQGRKLKDVLAERHSVAEGVTTAKAALKLAHKHNLDMPLTFATHAILHEDADIAEIVEKLLSRPFKAER